MAENPQICISALVNAMRSLGESNEDNTESVMIIVFQVLNHNLTILRIGKLYNIYVQMERFCSSRRLSQRNILFL